MKSPKEIRNELLKIGAVRRLEELNEERKILIKILEGDVEKRKRVTSTIRLRASNRLHHKGLHWTQKSKNKAKLKEMAKKSARTRTEKKDQKYDNGNS